MRVLLVFLVVFVLCHGMSPVHGSETPDGETVVPVLLHDANWHPDRGDWRTWAQRKEISPKFWVDREVSLKGSSSLVISGDNNPAAHGRWERTVPGIEGESWYRLTAHFKTRSVPYERQHVIVRLDWLDASGNRVGQPDYLTKNTKHGEWKQTTGTFQSPKQARAVKIELHLAWSPNGTVWWDDISLEKVAKPKGRRVTLAAVFHRPQGSESSQESVRQFCEMLERAAEEKPDIVCLPEAINMIGTGLTYVRAAEPVPGPSTKALGIVAKRHRFYVVAGLLERDGKSVYNTAVLLDRDGKLVGKYRKVYLPREEVEGGVTPGDGYPVFETDFGSVGMMICYDLQYVDPARALAAQGAEVILLPIWGGNITLAKARAIENQVYLVTSGYDMPTFIIDAQGEILAQASREKSIVSRVVDLDERIRLPWLGDMKARFWKEWRADVETPSWPQ